MKNKELYLCKLLELAFFGETHTSKNTLNYPIMTKITQERAVIYFYGDPEMAPILVNKLTPVLGDKLSTNVKIGIIDSLEESKPTYTGVCRYVKLELPAPQVDILIEALKQRTDQAMYIGLRGDFIQVNAEEVFPITETGELESYNGKPIIEERSYEKCCNEPSDRIKGLDAIKKCDVEGKQFLAAMDKSRMAVINKMRKQLSSDYEKSQEPVKSSCFNFFAKSGTNLFTPGDEDVSAAVNRSGL